MKELRRRIFFSIFLGLFFGNALYFGSRLADATINFKDYNFETIDILFAFLLTFIFTIIFYFVLGIKLKEKDRLIDVRDKILADVQKALTLGDVE